MTVLGQTQVMQIRESMTAQAHPSPDARRTCPRRLRDPVVYYNVSLTRHYQIGIVVLADWIAIVFIF